jgi:phospholipase/carboxylesterase
VLACIDAVRQHYRVDAQRIYVLGFSQGAGQAVSVGLHHPGLFRGIIAIGGWVDRAEYTRKELHRASREALVLLCHSPEDRVVPFSACESGAAFLEAHEVPYAVRAYPGGHRLPRELLQSILTWIEEPGPVAPALEEAHPAGTTPVPEAEPAEED